VAGRVGNVAAVTLGKEDPPIVTKILARLGLPTELPTLIPARSPPQPDGFDFT